MVVYILMECVGGGWYRRTCTPLLLIFFKHFMAERGGEGGIEEYVYAPRRGRAIDSGFSSITIYSCLGWENEARAKLTQKI